MLKVKLSLFMVYLLGYGAISVVEELQTILQFWILKFEQFSSSRHFPFLDASLLTIVISFIFTVQSEKEDSYYFPRYGQLLCPFHGTSLLTFQIDCVTG